jgi:hypothetical protein
MKYNKKNKIGTKCKIFPLHAMKGYGGVGV